ncbi:MAG TPA: heme biosynthesis HemY N-terminal domain-containing protein [Woeseiaceae bacterium]|nr:heme biosynthesis HemY N-terminal domain-containing protein [Woeseiaceae bacterium]
MKTGLIIIIVALLSAIVAQALFADPGYVAVQMRGHLFEMSVPALLLLIVLFIVALLALRAIVLAPRRLGEAAGRYRSGRAGKKLTRGMIEVAEGNLSRGEKLFARAAGASDSPLFNYLQAARAAHLQGQDERRDEWLRMAYEEIPEASNAVLLTQAEFQMDRRQYELALATLKKIDDSSGDHGQATALLGRIYYQLGDWNSLGELLPRLQKHRRVDPQTLEMWSVRVYREFLGRAGDGDALAEAWQKVPKKLKANLTLLEAYYTAMLRAGGHEQAEKELAATLKSEWRGPLARLFGLVEGKNASKQLKQAETWLGVHGDDPDLLLAAARLCLKNELWGKARSYLEAVIGQRPTPEAYQEYGKLLTKLGETDAAADAYRDGLGLLAEPAPTAIPHMKPDPR